MYFTSLLIISQFNTLTASQSFTDMPAAVILQLSAAATDTPQHRPSTTALSLAWRHAALSCGDSGQATSMPASA